MITRIIFALGVVVVVVGAIPYAVWMIQTAWKRRWTTVIRQITAAAIAFGVLYLLANPLGRLEYLLQMSRVFDTTFSLGDPLYEYDSERGFNGDGYSIQIYRLPEKVRKRFSRADSRLFTQFPKRPWFRSDWDTVHWRTAPFDPALSDYFDFAVGTSGTESDQEGRLQFDMLRAALKRSNVFYAFFKKDHGTRPGNIDFFVVDLESGKLYVINHNT